MISKRVDAFLEKYNLSNCHILVAFSGGYDSMCLLDVLKKIAPRHNIKLTALHLNHGWRGNESDLEEQKCKKFCTDIEFYSESLADNIPHTETAAREARYDFFYKCATKFNTNIIFTAHNANDNAETIFYRIMRGTGLTGLEGIPEKRDIFYRPILSVYRNEIEQYCNENNLTPNNDSSNKNSKYTRNKIRNEIFPALNKSFPEFEKNLNKLSQNAQFANKQIEKLVKPLEKYSTSEFNNLSSELQNTVIHKFLRLHNLDYDNKRIEDIVAFILETQHSKSGKTLSLTKDKWLFVSTKEIKVINKNSLELKEVQISTEGEYKIGDYHFSIEKNNTHPNKYPKDSEYIAYVALKDAKNLCMRTRKNGDIIQPLGLNGTQKLKKYLNEKKIPKHEKEKLIFLCQNNEILWAPGIGISEKIKVTSEPTHTLKLMREE